MTREQAEAIVRGIERARIDIKEDRDRRSELARLASRAMELGARNYGHLRAIADGETR